MNIHPAFVHFPIAFLFVYAVMELVRCKCLNEKPYWFYLKATFSSLGVFSAFVTMSTGEMAEGIWKDPTGPMAQLVALHPEKLDLIKVHAMFAGMTFLVFLLLAAAYLIEWVRREDAVPAFARRPGFFARVWALKLRYSAWMLGSMTALVLALLGLMFLFVLGALGADIVYGPEVDPWVGWVHSQLF